MNTLRTHDAEAAPAESNDNEDTWILLFDAALRVVATAMTQDDSPKPVSEAAE